MMTQFPMLIFLFLFCTLTACYIVAVIFTNRSYKKWPLHRIVCWCTGMFCAALAVIGPLANLAHVDFSVHMISHLLLGMLTPLFLAFSAPMTLLLRTVSTKNARILTKMLKSKYAKIITNPIATTIFTIGGLSLLYMTNLYMWMHENSIVYFIVHLHMLIAGYLFTISIIYIDPVFHRNSFLMRSIILIVALASHGIVAKMIYVYPPIGVPTEQAQQGGVVMYYGGDIIDAVIIFVLCLQWYKATKPQVIYKA